VEPSTSAVVRLREWTHSEPIALSEPSLGVVSGLGDIIELRPAPRGRWTLKPRGIVGRIQLPDCTLDLAPKYPIANLCRVIARVSGIPKLFESTTGMDEGGLTDLLIAAFVRRTEALLSAGLRRNYVEKHERLQVLRGRLDLASHLLQPEPLRTSFDCRHEDYNLHTRFNAVLRQTADACRTHLPALSGRVLRLRHRLASLPRSSFRSGDLDGFQYDRLTESYRPVHRLCRLILAGTGLGLGTAQETGTSFAIKMWPLFERFVSVSLRTRLSAPWRLETQEQVALDRGGAIEVRPDIVVYEGTRPAAIVDAKYVLRDDGTPTSGNAFQVLAYARRYGVRTGWLVYPDRPEGARVFVCHDKQNEVASFGLDLSADWSRVEAGLDQLAAQITLGRNAPPSAARRSHR